MDYAPRYANSTDSEGRLVTWTQGQKKSRLLYLVEDRSRTAKLFIDCFFLFTDPLKAIEKARILGYGDTGYTLDQQKLTPGVLYRFQRDDVDIVVIAIEMDEGL
jgi:hypothetical protein